ncbi:ATP-binding protein [soil metagenome]
MNLADCAAEPIRTPGSIQPHGRLLVLDAESSALVAFSANWGGGPTGEEAAGVLARLDTTRFAKLVAGASPVSLGTLRIGGQAFDVSAHRTTAHCIVEFEAASVVPGDEAPIYSLTRAVLPKLQEADSLLKLAELAAQEMKRLTGFGRCLVYRFDEAGDGEVLAEQVEPGYQSYAGHHFPAADIPSQARDLYVLNQFRLIADADYEPVPLMALTEVSAGAIDLSQAQLRSVSPIHLEYMRNMGTLASMSVSIVIEGRLWGLISCHDHGPRHLDMPVKRACEHLGQLLALRIQSSEATSSAAHSLALRQQALAIVSHLSDSDATLQRLVDEPAPLLRLTRSHGAAVVLDDRLWTVGDVPADAHIQALAHWVSGLGVEVYESSALAEDFSPAADFEHAAGVLAVSISQVHRHLILWFRPEIVRTITWAGDPRKQPPSADGRIHPRASFASWAEEVRGSSVPWSAAELGAVAELRQTLVGIVLRRAEELAAIATELGRVNKELEAFSYTVSHDLRAPMRHIAGYIDLVTDIDGKQLSARTLRYLSQAKEASVFAGELVDALLDFSRMSRSAIKRKALDANLLVADLVRELDRQQAPHAIEWQVAQDLPTLAADPLLLQLAVRNLLTNAVKYSHMRRPARITVRGVSNADGDGLEIEDNGVGFQMKYVAKLFGVFQRLHPAEEFEGTGIGLASVKRIVERHGGVVWAHGDVDRGARFGFTLPRAAPRPGNGPEPEPEHEHQHSATRGDRHA